MNGYAARAIYISELTREWNALLPSVAGPIVSTALYFVVFGVVMGKRMAPIDGISYGAFIVPGLVMLTVITDTLSSGAISIFIPKASGTVYEVLSAPVSTLEIIAGYIGSVTSKSLVLGALVLITARVFVEFHIRHPLGVVVFLLLASLTFSFLGFLLGMWAERWQSLATIPILIVSPLAFLGGTFYSVGTLPPPWQRLTLSNPVTYFISGFRWSFSGISDVSVLTSVLVTTFLLALSAAATLVAIRTGYKLKS